VNFGMVDKKLLELKTFAKVIDSCENRRIMMRRLNGLVAGYSRGYNNNPRRINALKEIIKNYK
jgi:hypothetical protein